MAAGRDPMSKELRARRQKEKILSRMGKKRFFDYTLKQKLLFLVIFLLAMALFTLCGNGIYSVTSFLGGYMEAETNIIRMFGRIARVHPLAALAIVALSFLIAHLIMSRVATKRRNRDPRGFKILENGTEGRSRLMDADEKRKVFQMLDYDSPDGIVLGVDKETKELITLPWNPPDPDYAPENYNIALFGPPGSRKTTGVILPNIFNFIAQGLSIAVTDPKGELYQKTIAAARYMDYNIKIFNLLTGQFKNSDGWDVLKHIRESENPIDAADFAANILMANTGGQSGDQFWFDGNINCLKLCLLFVAKAKGFISGLPPNSKGETRTIESFYDLLTSKDMASKIETAINANPEDERLLSQLYNIWRSHPQNEAIRSGLGIRLGILQNPDLARILSEDEIVFEEMNDRPTIIYVMCSDKDRTYKSILTLFMSFMFRDMTDIADSHDSGALDTRLMIVIEECGNIGKIPDLAVKASTLRSRHIGMIFCYQTLGQMMDVYSGWSADSGKHEWETILADCATQLCLSANDLTGQKYFAEMTGKMTVEVEMTAQQVNSMAPEALKWNPSERRQRTGRGIPVMRPDDIKKIKPWEILICMATNDATLEGKYYFKDHPMYNIQMVDKNEEVVTYSHRKHIPAWRLHELLIQEREVLNRAPQTAREMLDDGCTPKYIEGYAKSHGGEDDMHLPWFLKPFERFIEFEFEDADEDIKSTAKNPSGKSYHDFLMEDTYKTASSVPNDDAEGTTAPQQGGTAPFSYSPQPAAESSTGAVFLQSEKDDVPEPVQSRPQEDADDMEYNRFTEEVFSDMDIF